MQTFWNVANLLAHECQIQLALFPLPDLQYMDKKHTPKPFNTTCMKDIGETGNFVEYQGHGGIITLVLNSTRVIFYFLFHQMNCAHLLRVQ
jgi:hypothetical protein